MKLDLSSFSFVELREKERIFVVRSNIKRDSAKEVETKLSHLGLRTNHLLSTIVTTSHRKKEDINS